MIGEPDLKILVLSDSHRAIGAMYDAAMLEDPDAIMHLGDHVSDAEELSYALDLIDFYRVKGNCDFGAQAPETILTELGGARLFLTHGHLYNVNYGRVDSLVYAAQEAGAQLAMFGHTHQAYYEQIGGVQVLNPGTAGCGRELTWALIEIFDNGAFACEIRKL